MQNDKTNPLPSLLVPSVEQTTAMLEKEETEQDAQMQGSPPTGVESAALYCIYATKIVHRRKFARN